MFFVWGPVWLLVVVAAFVWCLVAIYKSKRPLCPQCKSRANVGARVCFRCGAEIPRSPQQDATVLAKVNLSSVIAVSVAILTYLAVNVSFHPVVSVMVSVSTGIGVISIGSKCSQSMSSKSCDHHLAFYPSLLLFLPLVIVLVITSFVSSQ